MIPKKWSYIRSWLCLWGIIPCRVMQGHILFTRVFVGNILKWARANLFAQLNGFKYSYLILVILSSVAI